VVLVLDDASRRVRVVTPICLGALAPRRSDEDDRPEIRVRPLTEPNEASPNEVEEPTQPIATCPAPVTSAPSATGATQNPSRSAPAIAVPPPERVVSSAEWRAHAVELDAARGPKPVGVIEKLFAQRYVPLLGAVARGEVDSAVRSVVDAWRTSFEHS